MTEETADADESASTVEWGSPATKRATERAIRRGRRRPRLPLSASRTSLAAGCAGVGFVLAVLAQLLPWARLPVVSPAVLDNPEGPVTTGAMKDVGLEVLQFSPLVFVYDALWSVLFACVAVAFVVGRRRRRVVCAAGLGVAAGQLLVLAGIVHGISNIVDSIGFSGGGVVRVEVPAVAVRQGIYFAVGAVLLVGLALVLRTAPSAPAAASAPRESDEEGEFDAPVPADLTVTPLEPFQSEVDWRRPRDIDMRSGWRDEYPHAS
jgi:hypothetical protein